LRDLIRISREKPVVWTLHDIWAVTGFAYNSITRKNPNKKRFLLYLWDNTAHLLRIKEKIYKKCRLNIVAISEWVKLEAENGILAGQNTVRIYNGIDTAMFHPRDKIMSRKALGLPLDKKIIGCGIKGWQESNRIIDSYSNRDDVFFVTVGHDNIKTNNKNFKALPRTENRDTVSNYVSALNLLIHPTDEEAFGLFSAEAMACGIPIVTYGVDAMPEVVAHLETGYVAKYKDLDDFKRGIEHVLNLSTEKYLEMSRHARQRVCDKFSLERMLEEYLEFYKQILIG
ncbi:MAG: glycosyltransferase, partial [Candidatus Taylorbacteria bacterium]|nr:glycosyltransferase [Candidatus Taylorbacteria bacterium]